MPNTAYPRRTNGLPGPPPSNGHASHPPPHPPPSNAPPPLSLVHSGPPPQGPSVLQILAMGQERNHAADSIAHHPRIESLVKLGKESEATWLQIGATAETLGDFDRATTSYESALRHNAYSIVALSQIAAICRSKEEFKKAAEYFGRVVDIAPESGDVWGALGHCYLMIDDLKKAYSSYQQALYYMSNPQEPKLWYGIGILYDRYGSLEHAEEAFSSVIRMDPGFEKANEIFFRLGIIYKQQRKSAQSLECFRYILQNPPRPLTEIDIWFQIGHVYEQQKDYLAAKESYERVLVENPAHAKVLQQLGGLYHRSRAPFYNPELSVNILTKSLESDANDPFSWYLLGRAYMTTNNFGKAYEAYQQAVYRDGKNPAFWCSIGVLYYNINQFHDALDAYSRAIRIHPYLAEVWFNLGALYESCNDQMTDAIDAYQRTLQLDPSNAIVATRLREIQIHQSTGAPLSSPPTPKDISPSSLSWNYATNAGGAPAHPSGLGLELSPALSRPGGASAGSPPTGHRFEGPPPNRRSDSTETYRNEDRQRASGSMAHHSPSTSMDHSPHISRRISGPLATPLPQIKPHENRDSPRISSASDIHRRPSPLSPRTRHSDTAHDNPYPPHSSYPGPPSGSHSSYPRPGDSSEMDWYRNGNPESRNGSAGGRGIPSQPPRRSPPHGSNSRDPRDYQSGPPAPGFDRHYASPGPPGSSSRPSILRDSDPRGPPPAAAPYPSQHFPRYGQYPPQHPYQPFYDPNMRRQDVREREEEDERRRGSGPVSRVEASPPRAPTPAMLQGDREGSVQSVGSNGPSTAVIPKGRGGRTARGKAITVKKETSTSRSRRTAKEGSDASPPTRRRGGNKMDGGSPTKRTKSGAAQTGPSKATCSADNASDTSKSSLNHSTTPIPFVPSSTLAAREIDEDYDEGVDALMGLATSHGKSPSLPAPSPPVAVVPARTETPIEGSSTPDVAADDQAIETEKEVNPRKRPLESPPLEESESKRTKNDSEAEVEPKMEVDVEVDSVTESAAEPAPEATPVPETTPSAAETEPEAEETVVKAQEAAVAEEATTEAAVEESVEESMEAEVEAPVVEQEAQPKIESLTPPATDDAESMPAVDVEKSEEIAEAEKEMEVEEGEVLADAKPISEKESSPVEESVA